MEQNKIIDSIYKKLLKADYDHKEIRDFIDIKNSFHTFENYLSYLLLLSQTKYDDIKFKMANVCSDYLITITERYNIKPLLVNNLKPGDILTNQEIYILGAKGYDGNHQFYFDNEDNLYICLDRVEHFSYQNKIINIKFAEYFDGFIKSKINQKILTRKFKNILVFQKTNMNNTFVGFYNFVGFEHYYKKSEQLYGFSIINADHDGSEEELIQFKNLINRQSEESLNNLKNELTQIINSYKNDSFNFLNLINMSYNHMILLFNVIQYALINKNQKIINEIKRRYGEMLQQGLSIFNLVPNQSFINEYFLVILSNKLDILYGMQINADYMNNIFICLNKSSMEIDHEDNTITMRFVKSYQNKFFDLDINKKIFNTTYSNGGIYLFQKTESNNYLFLGFYKVFKIIIDTDRKKKPTPVFKLKKMSNEEFNKHVNYCLNPIVDNSWENVFFDIITKSKKVKEWSNMESLVQVKSINVEQDRLNSNQTKYNWIIKKCLTTFNTPEFSRYYNSYIEFDHRIIDWVLLSLSGDFETLINKQLMEPWTIAYEMTKRNYGNKELFHISYIDHYKTKKHKYELCLSLLNESRK